MTYVNFKHIWSKEDYRIYMSIPYKDQYAFVVDAFEKSNYPYILIRTSESTHLPVDFDDNLIGDYSRINIDGIDSKDIRRIWAFKNQTDAIIFKLKYC